jgi:hypothetical protein
VRARPRVGPFVGALGVAAAALVVSAGPGGAAGTASPMTQQICDATAVPCSVQVDPVWFEGTSREVVVTGHPDTTVGIHAFRVDDTAPSGPALTAYGPVVEVTTDANGFGAADLRLPEVADDASGGPLLFAPADSAGSPLSEILGTWSVLASRRPLVLGDGYAAAKPVGVELSLQLTAAAPDTGFDVEIERDGRWQSLSTGTTTCPAPADTCIVRYEVPRGLRPADYAVRLVNTTSGIPVADWHVRPTADGQPAAVATMSTPSAGADLSGAIVGAGNAVPRPRAQTLDVPDVAAGVPGASAPVGHSPATLHGAAAGVAAAAVLVAVVGAATGSRHRSALLRRVARVSGADRG